ncbi:MAG: desulfoferrodoxin FeS4 iron-binding domain-containing protein [Candidatus Aenigmarchaeota archaeon]|nr:desulfoferrodoxin FeS4 iron-binding domain-containing protein [Candidatus Aenigmarchaeota archaeon]
MSDKKVGDKFKCNVCGNVVEMVNVGGGTLVCCDRPMQKYGDISASLLERKDDVDEMEKEELKEMVEELQNETEDSW